MKSWLMVVLIALLSSAFASSAQEQNTSPAEGLAYLNEASLTLESVSIIHGGLSRGHAELANLDLIFQIDTAAAGWWENGEWFVYVLGNAGKNPSDYAGDLQGISNIATDEAIKIYEFWYQHSFASEQVKLLVGMHDYNSTFYSLDAAGLFAHPSFGIGADVSQVGPSIFSTTAMAAHLTVESESQYLLVAVYDGIPGDPDNPRGTHVQFNSGDGLFSAMEWGWVPADGDKVALGMWQHSAEVTSPITNELIDNNHGVYLIAEKKLNDEAAIFLQLGRAADQYNQLEYYAGTGLNFSSVWRPDDGLGLAVALARNGDNFLASDNELQRTETAWELAYYLPVIKNISAQASLYYIQQPSMDKQANNALAIGSRIYIEF